MLGMLFSDLGDEMNRYRRDEGDRYAWIAALSWCRRDGSGRISKANLEMDTTFREKREEELNLLDYSVQWRKTEDATAAFLLSCKLLKFISYLPVPGRQHYCKLIRLTNMLKLRCFPGPNVHTVYSIGSYISLFLVK